MVNTELLKQTILEKGLKIGFVAEKCGLTYQGLHNKMEGRHKFNITEAFKIKQILDLDDSQFQAIFFAGDVDCENTKEVI